jgi:ATP-dependent helicase HrpB
MTRESLPIDSILPDIVQALRSNSSAVVRAPAGAGKTTRIPPALLDSQIFAGRILMLEPRRLAARAAARRMAAERDGRVGGEIGYQVRFDRQWGKSSRIVVVTPGILLRMLLDDPMLEAVDAVLFDEFHERGLESDLALGMVRQIQDLVRPELRILVMSATLAVEAVSAYLGGCPIIVSEGRLHPVQIVYEPKLDSLSWPEFTARALERRLRDCKGDALAFLPGVGEIRATARELEPLARQMDMAVLPLYGDLPAELQDAALLPQPRRKIVLATNVAETSVTVEGVTLVVDTGLVRTLRFDPSVGLDRLELEPASRASADQRAGRAGRTAPGICVRLWSELGHRARREQTEPEIRRVDLAGALLQLLCLGESDVARFPWLEAPKPAAIATAKLLLERLGAVDVHGLTDLGRLLARLPVHPRLGRLLVEGRKLGRERQAALAAALLSERDPLVRDGQRAAAPDTFSDLQDRLEVLEKYESGGTARTFLGAINPGAAEFLLRTRDQLLRVVENEVPIAGEQTPTVEWTQALLAAFPDRLARRREPASNRGVMVGGRGVRLAPSSGVREPDLFLCLDVDAGEGEAWVRMASGVRREWLTAESLTTSTDVEFDPGSERISARKRLRFLDLVIDETSANLPSGEKTDQILIEAAARNLDAVFPPEDSPAAHYLLRLRCLSTWMPELSLPTFGEDDLREMLKWLCAGARSFDDIRKADWLSALHARFSHAQRQIIEREAPERIEVPSGSRIVLKYELGRPPILAVRIQELFGLAQTPRVAGGRVSVLLHLPGPNYRPQQVTDDLASFWANTYPLIRRELRARYPKHAWPEDPLAASPEKRPQRRK